jgi:hypothetical protein
LLILTSFQLKRSGTVVKLSPQPAQKFSISDIAKALHTQINIDRLLTGTAQPTYDGVVWWSSYLAAHHHRAVVPQFGAKDQFYSTVYKITLNPICVAQKASNFLMWKILLEVV